jgi:hypothetical protein
MACVTFSCVPTQYAPKRKFIEFAKPKWHNKLGEFSDPDVLSWVNRLYQDKKFKTPKDFNEAYDAGLIDVIYWRNKTMVLNKEDLELLEQEFNDGAFDDSHEKQKLTGLIAKLKRALESEKTVFVY